MLRAVFGIAVPRLVRLLLGAVFVLALIRIDRQHASAADGKPVEEKPLADELPRIPPTAAQDALKTFKLEHGFHLELVASEPRVTDPVDACFDENGRMYVAEMQDYPYSPEPRPQCPEGIGRPEAGVIRLLEDLDEDGIFDRSTVFADKLEWPTSVLCYRGGVFVIAPPHVYYFKDTDGDGVADVREIVYSGFGRGNVQGLANNMKWSLDNHIVASAGMNGGEITHRGKKLLTLSGYPLLRWDPATEVFEYFAGASQFGHATDDWGNRFVCNNSNHIQHVVFPAQYLSRNPNLAAPEVIRSISKEGGAGPVFRQSPVEPWRLVRTRRRAADPQYRNRLPPSELVPIGFFTSATGVTIYRGDAYPPEFRGNAFIGDVGGNLIHRKTLTPVGASFLAVRADDKTEFITSTDNWFRPVNFVNAPDGTLYILDMYRETIEHPFSIPEDIKKHLDLESGHDRGRIYRLASPGWKRSAPPKLGGKSATELVAELSSSNSWNRETAQRLLWERQDKAAVEPLKKMATKSPMPLGRLHALWTLVGLQAMTPEVLLVALDDSHAGVREHAVRICDSFVNSAPQVVDKLLTMTADENYRVQFQLAFTLGEIKSPQRAEGLAKLAKRVVGDADLSTAWLSSVSGQEGELVRRLLADASFDEKSNSSTLLAQLAGLIGTRNQPAELAHLLTTLAAPDRLSFDTRQRLLVALGEGLSRRGSTVSQILQKPEVDATTRERIDALFQEAAKIAQDGEKPLPERSTALGLLACADFSVGADAFAASLTPQAPQPLQTAAVRALSFQGDPWVIALLIDNWRGFGPTTRRDVVDALMRSIPRLTALLTAVQEGKIKLGEIERDKKQLLLNHPNERIRNQARQLLASEVAPNRAKVLADYQATLQIQGNAERGQEVFKKNCAGCHQVGQLGHAVGPNLASTQNKTPSDLLINILDPNREALPAYTSYTLETDSGKIFSGIIASETATSVTLRRAEAAQDVVLRNNIVQLLSSGVSLMPEGLEKDISLQQMADLIEFVRSIKPETK